MEPKDIVAKATEICVPLKEEKVIMAFRVACNTIGTILRVEKLLRAKPGSSDKFDAQDELQDFVAELMSDYLMLLPGHKILLFPAFIDFVWHNEELICREAQRS